MEFIREIKTGKRKINQDLVTGTIVFVAMFLMLYMCLSIVGIDLF